MPDPGISGCATRRIYEYQEESQDCGSVQRSGGTLTFRDDCLWEASSWSYVSSEILGYPSTDWKQSIVSVCELEPLWAKNLNRTNHQLTWNLLCHLRLASLSLFLSLLLPGGDLHLSFLTNCFLSAARRLCVHAEQQSGWLRFESDRGQPVGDVRSWLESC